MPTSITLTTNGIVYDPAGFATIGDVGDRIQCPPTGVNAVQGWLAFRIRAGFTSPGPANKRILTYGPDTNEELILQWFTDSAWRIRREVASVSTEATIADTFALNDLITIIAAWDATTIKVSLDGAAFVSVGNTTISNVGAVDLDFGSRGYAGTEQWVGDFLWVIGGTGILSDANAATIHGYGDTDPPQSGLPGTATLWWGAASDAGMDLRGDIIPPITYPSGVGVRW